MSGQLNALATAAASVEPISRVDSGKDRLGIAIPMPSLARAKSCSSDFPQELVKQSIPIQSITRDKTADWHLLLSVEERQLIRSKIKSSYSSRARTYEELLETCSAIEEEMLYLFAPSRLDYFKNGMQFDKRVVEKRRQISGSICDVIPGNMKQVCKEEPSDKPVLKRFRSNEI